MKSLDKKPKLIVFDVDKTLTSQNTWYELTRMLGGDVEQHFQLYQKQKNGDLPPRETTRLLIEMLEKARKRKIHRDEIYTLLFQIKLKGEAISTFKDLQSLGYDLALVSTSMQLLVEIIAERLNVDTWHASSVLHFDDHEYLNDITFESDEGKAKLKAVKDILKAKGYAPSECLIIGDGSNDCELFKVFPGVAYDADNDELKKLAWKEIRFLPTLLQLLAQFDK